MTNDRWGIGAMCTHGGYLTCADRYNPGHLMSRKFENAMTLDKRSWGYNRLSVSADHLTFRELLMTMAQTVAYGGNILINVGPRSDGTIEPLMEERLTQLGAWLDVNGKAIYSTKPWQQAQNDSLTPNVYYTQSASTQTVYAIFFEWSVTSVRAITLHLSVMHSFILAIARR